MTIVRTSQAVVPRAAIPWVVSCTGTLWLAITWWVVTTRAWPQTPVGVAGLLAMFAALLWFAAAGIALTVIDVQHHRLPNMIVLPSLAGITLLLAMSSLLTDAGPHWQQLWGVVGGAVTLFAIYLSVVMISPNAMGGGDVKLAPLTGALLGFFGLGCLIVGAAAAFVLGGLYSLALVAFGRDQRTSQIPFGPFMIAGTWVGVVFSERLIHAYFVLFGITG